MLTKVYIEELCVPFGEYLGGKADETALVSAFQFWYFSLPKYTKGTSNSYIGNGKTSGIDSSILRLKDCLRSPELDADNFLFEKLPAIFNEVDLSVLVGHVLQARSVIDNTLPSMLEALQKDVCSIFHCYGRSDLWQTLSGWYNGLPGHTKRHCFECGEDRLLKAAIKSGDSISAFCSIMTGLEPEYFEETTPTLLFDKISEYKTVIENHASGWRSEAKNTYSINLDGQAIKTFGKTPDVSKIGRLMENELTAVVSEYGQAVNLNEKRQILLNVLDGIGNVMDEGARDDLH